MQVCFQWEGKIDGEGWRQKSDQAVLVEEHSYPETLQDKGFFLGSLSTPSDVNVLLLPLHFSIWVEVFHIFITQDIPNILYGKLGFYFNLDIGRSLQSPHLHTDHLTLISSIKENKAPYLANTHGRLEWKERPFTRALLVSNLFNILVHSTLKIIK